MEDEQRMDKGWMDWQQIDGWRIHVFFMTWMRGTGTPSKGWWIVARVWYYF